MDIDYDGGMLVGCHGSEFSVAKDCPEHYFDDICLGEGESIEDLDKYEVLDGLGMEIYCENYDAGICRSHVGFPVGDVEVRTEDFEEWLAGVKVKAAKFEEITGIKAKLIGCQGIW